MACIYYSQVGAPTDSNLDKPVISLIDNGVAKNWVITMAEGLRD
jgi:hypothetical protein